MRRNLPMQCAVLLPLLLLIAVGACDRALDPATPIEPAFAKGGGGGGKPPQDTTHFPAATTIHDLDLFGAPTQVRSDGRGTYVDGACGVNDGINLRSDGMWGTALSLRAALTAEKEAACGGRRVATVQLLVRHLSDSPHIDDSGSPMGEFGIADWGFVLDIGAGKINTMNGAVWAPCYSVGRNGRVSGYGLRFDPGGFPGSSSLSVTQTAAHSYRVQTRPYPDNIAYCENNDGVSYWHVIMDFEVQPTG